MLIDILKTRKERVGSVTSVVDSLQKNPQIKDMFPELVKFVQLTLTIPVSSSTTERSFPSLRILKTYLRSTMVQKYLNHLAILIVPQGENNSLNIDSRANEVICGPEIRPGAGAGALESAADNACES
uniref:HAT C-terminal dimerisation domain-containing protein n=1 Tax=Timema bartmani TaxID=61472 RepID=A0A7R9F5L4_9NEOP|nr:unnamed protein product [Timema bartmani]